MMQTPPQAVRRSRAQDGFVLPMVLVMLAVGALMLIPALQFSWASLKASQVTEWKASEIYDADSGVDEAVRWLQFDGQVGSGWTEVASPPAGEWQRSALAHELNGSDVDVTIEEVATNTYMVTSTAVSGETGTSTTVVAYVVLSYSDFSMLLENAITSDGTVTIKHGVTIDGDVRLPDGDDVDNKGTLTGIIKTDEDYDPIVWPEAEWLMEYYMDSLESEAPYTLLPEDELIWADTSETSPYVLGPALSEGNFNLNGLGRGDLNSDWVRLDGTVYVGGSFNTGSSPTMVLDLNGQTIFAEDSIYIDPGVTLRGSGCLIAVGDVDFQPSVTSGEGEFILIMSVNGTTWLKPGTDFYGCVVGDATVDLWGNATLTYESPEGHDINFPQGTGTIGQPGTSITVPSYVIS